MLARQSLYVLCAFGLLCAGSVPAPAKGPRHFAQGETMVHIEAGSAGPSRGRLGTMSAPRSGTSASTGNVELMIKVLDTPTAASGPGSYRLKFFNRLGR
jgi:hypothetical protein